MKTTADTSRPESVLRDAAITIVALFLAFAAFDDITTDNDTNFTVEYVALMGCAVWLLFVTTQLFRRGRYLLGGMSLAALAGAIWAQSAIHVGISGFWPEYVVALGAFVWFAAIALILGIAGVRPYVSKRRNVDVVRT